MPLVEANENIGRGQIPVKRMLSAVSLVSLAVGLLLSVGATTASAATVMSTSSASSAMTNAQHHDDYPDYFWCDYKDYSHHGNRYQCYYKYTDDHGKSKTYYWWLDKNYNPPGHHPDYPKHFQCHYEDYNHHGKQYHCYNEYNHKTYYWWWNYNPPNWW